MSEPSDRSSQLDPYLEAVRQRLTTSTVMRDAGIEVRSVELAGSTESPTVRVTWVDHRSPQPSAGQAEYPIFGKEWSGWDDPGPEMLATLVWANVLEE